MRHEIPTHLSVEDTILAGMTMRQTLLVTFGGVFAYGGWLRLHWVVLALRWPLALLPIVFGLAFAFIRPAGRPLEQWLMLRARYALIPKIFTWRRRRIGGAHAPTPTV